jgi:hypothetical protein
LMRRPPHVYAIPPIYPCQWGVFLDVEVCTGHTSREDLVNERFGR